MNFIKFKLYDNHIIKFDPEWGQVSCDTCAVSAVIARAVEFAVQNNVHSLVVDGADLKRL